MRIVDVWSHFLTASRMGDKDVKVSYALNMFWQGGITVFLFFLWYCISGIFFSEFKPFSYWNLNGDFVNSLILSTTPLALYAFFLGQLDWFSSNDDYESGTIVSESLPFKFVVSLSAGVFEELTHRCITIYFCLISVCIANLFFGWFILFVIVMLFIIMLSVFNLKSEIALVSVVLFSFALLYVRYTFLNNPILIMNDYIFWAMTWVASSKVVIFLILSVLMALALIVSVIKMVQIGCKISIFEYCIRVISFGIWCAYIIPLGVFSIQNMPIIPEMADKWTTLLYISAVLLSNAKFGNGHQYQGPSGILNSYVLGLYFFHIAFSYGLMYAIIAHFLFDAVLLLSEHVVQVIKNRHLMGCR